LRINNKNIELQCDGRLKTSKIFKKFKIEGIYSKQETMWLEGSALNNITMFLRDPNLQGYWNTLKEETFASKKKREIFGLNFSE